MKARIFKKITLGLVLSALPFVGACNQTSNAPQSLLTAAQAEPSVAPDSSTVALAGEPVAPATTLPETATVPVPNFSKTLPPNIKPSSPVGEVVKLAQSGVDENVMLTYVGNAGGLFNLGSDEIIYLNDIGVPSGVVTAMIQRDESLKQTWTATSQAQSATAQANAQAVQAAAPTYVNPPQPEPQPTVAEAAPSQQPANVTYNYFYDSLSPYGSWIDVQGYGRCWQPTVVVVNRGWRPYCDRGRWLYTDAGWYWNSDYSWGATTFHYGRWFNDTSLGWCWYPDNVWASSWVTWRSSGDYCGWAPLPPTACYRPSLGLTYYNNSVGLSFGFGLGADCFTFVSWNNFCNRQPSRYCAPATHVTQIYNNTTVINNYVSGHNNTIINGGVPIDRVRRRTGAEIRQVAIRDAGNGSNHATRGEQLERDGRTLVVHRPNLPQSAGDTPAAAQQMRGSQPRRTPAAGAGAATLIEAPRTSGADRTTRAQSGLPSPVSSSRLAEGRTATQSSPAVSGNAHATSPAARTTPGGSGTSLSRDERSNFPTRDRVGENNRPATTAPLIVRGGERTLQTPSSPAPQRSPTLNPPPAQKPPAGSLIVIGRRDSNPGQNRANFNESRSTSAGMEASASTTRAWSAAQTAPVSRSPLAPQVQSLRASAPQPMQSLAFNHVATPTARQISPSSRAYSVPSQSAPSPRVQTYSAPQPSPASALSMPSYSAPRSSPAPAPSYTPATSRAPAAATPVHGLPQPGRNGSSRRN